jgi:hypothetical protein
LSEPAYADEKDPPVAAKAAAVAVPAYRDKAPFARTVAVCAVPLDASFINKPLERAPVTIVAKPLTVPAVPPTTAVAPVFEVVATNNSATPFVRVKLLAVLLRSVFEVDPALLWSVAVADGAATTDNIPANKAVVAVSAIRLRSVVFDIFFLSLVRIRNFLTLARRSFDPLIPYLQGTHV